MCSDPGRQLPGGQRAENRVGRSHGSRTRPARARPTFQASRQSAVGPGPGGHQLTCRMHVAGRSLLNPPSFRAVRGRTACRALSPGPTPPAGGRAALF